MDRSTGADAVANRVKCLGDAAWNSSGHCVRAPASRTPIDHMYKRLLGSAFAFTIGCSPLLDLHDTQCETEADCSKTQSLAGRKCVQGIRVTASSDASNNTTPGEDASAFMRDGAAEASEAKDAVADVKPDVVQPCTLSAAEHVTAHRVEKYLCKSAHSSPIAMGSATDAATIADATEAGTSPRPSARPAEEEGAVAGRMTT
jgi:hypothetical protein